MLTFETDVDYDNFDFTPFDNNDCLKASIAFMYNDIMGTHLTYDEIARQFGESIDDISEDDILVESSKSKKVGKRRI